MPHVLIFKNQEKRCSQVYRTDGNVHLFDTVDDADQLGQLVMKDPNKSWDAFATMGLQTFLNMMCDKWSLPA